MLNESVNSDFSLAIAFTPYSFVTVTKLLGVTLNHISYIAFINFIFFKCVAINKVLLYFCDR